MSTTTPRKLRVLMVTPRFFPDMGGVETHVYEVGRRLVQAGVEVTVVSTLERRLHPDLPRLAEIEGMKVMRAIAWPRMNDLCVAPEVYALARSGNWDLIHVQGIHTAVPLLGMQAARRSRTPFVVTFHSGGHSSALRNQVRALQWKALRPLLAGAQGLIGVSRFEANYFQNVLGLPTRQFSVIPNGATLPKVEKPTLPTPGRTLIVSVGRLERYKGHQHLITALPKIREQRPEAELLILGAGPYEAELRALARQSSMEAHVEIRAIPASDRQGMAAILSQAALVALLSEYESHGIAVIEALALQRPVLGTHTTGLQELAEQGLIRTIPLHSSPEVIAAAALEQIERPLAAQHVALPTWDGCAEKLFDLYERVA